MIGALLLAAAAPTAVDAERAFAAHAQKVGQWTAFRDYAEPTAVMFDPQAVWAHEFLEGRKDPPKSVEWWPAQSYVSCDGRTAVNTGPWLIRDRNLHGQFTTVWLKQPNGGWKWTYDAGEPLAKPLPRPRRAEVRRASCASRRAIPAAYVAAARPTEQMAGASPGDAGQGRSADGTLIWSWKVAPDGTRQFETKLWNGRAYRTVIIQQVAAPKP